MIIQFLCPYCSQWEKRTKFQDHMWDHAIQGDDVGTMKVPQTYEDYRRRFSAVGLFEERQYE